MSETNLPQTEIPSPSQFDDEIDLIELWNTLWAERKLIMIVTGIFAVISVIYSLTLTNIYRAETLLMPITEGQSTQMSAQLGLAATLVGVDLNSGTDQAQIAMATLRSREFITAFIRENGLLPWLFASEFIAEREESEIDDQLYDAVLQIWIEQEIGEDATPSDWEAYRLFSALMTVDRSLDTGLVTVTLEWPDPVLASRWLNLLVGDLNDFLRNRDQTEATKAIEFLQSQLPVTNLVEMERLLYQLIESQTRVLMLADVREDYRFQVIDPSYVPEEKVRPRRSIICILGTIAGGLLAILFVFVRRGLVNYQNRLSHLNT